MIMPNCELAYIQRRKLTHYLLSLTHPVGRSKAKFLRRFGFNEKNIELLEERLLSIAQLEDIFDKQETEHGTKYIIIGDIPTPRGIVIRMRTVWIVDAGNIQPRFVTAYPA